MARSIERCINGEALGSDSISHEYAVHRVCYAKSLELSSNVETCDMTDTPMKLLLPSGTAAKWTGQENFMH
jgi:hypothetical protein